MTMARMKASRTPQITLNQILHKMSTEYCITFQDINKTFQFFLKLLLFNIHFFWAVGKLHGDKIKYNGQF